MENVQLEILSTHFFRRFLTLLIIINTIVKNVPSLKIYQDHEFRNYFVEVMY
jgi:hypothetical protein